MIYIHTLFDRQRRPVLSAFYDRAAKTHKFIPMRLPGSNITYADIDKNQKTLAGIIEKCSDLGRGVVMNDVKTHMVALGMSCSPTHFYDVNPGIVKHENSKKNALLGIKHMVDTELKPWHNIKASAAVAYASMQRRGTLYGDILVHPIWDMDTYSGRSRTSGFNIQGVSDEPIRNPNGESVFIHFDWVAADFMMAAAMSQDGVLLKSFDIEDPYSYAERIINHDVPPIGRISRKDIKISMLKALYSIDADDQIIGIYPRLREWMLESLSGIEENGYAESILGRRFYVGGERTQKSAFNAAVQGSVAHAMQLVVRKVWDKCPSNIMCETHDSLTITSGRSADEIKEKIALAAGIMIDPFKGILNNRITMPIKVSVGTNFKKWQLFRRYPDEQTAKKPAEEN